MTTKKISVNPELFRVSNSRTRRQKKNAEEREAPTISLSSAYRDIATSARLKKKLQSRLNKSIPSLSASYSRAATSLGHRPMDEDDDEDEGMTYNPSSSLSLSHGRGGGGAGSSLSRRGMAQEEDDEFSHSVRYLQQLKQQLHQQQMRQQQEMQLQPSIASTGAAHAYHNTSYSHPTAASTMSTTPVPSPYQYVSLEVPAELKSPAPAIASAAVAPLSVLENRDDVPFGCLKGGRKKTFREWKDELMEQEQPVLPAAAAAFFTPRPPTPPKTFGGDDAKLSGVNAASNALAAISVARENRERNRGTGTGSDLPFSITKRNRGGGGGGGDGGLSATQNGWLHSTFKNHGTTPAAMQRKNVQTFRRKYTVGKFDKLNKVSVLIKDQMTQKNILQMHRTLKKTPVADMRKYLRQRGLIKIGSVCPPDLLRKMFESAVLAGEITNMNKNTMLHNLMHMDKEKERG